MKTDDEPISVLLVEDNRDFSELAEELLEDSCERLVVETTHSAADALDRVETEAPDCVVCDYLLPDRDGIDLFEAVREIDAHVPFILLTGKGSEEVASEAISAGVTDYVQKGMGADQYALLANRVVKAVERAAAKRERERQLAAIETAREGISILDPDGTFRYVNEAYAEYYGYEPADLVGEHWEVLYREADVDRIYEEILPAVRAEGTWHGTTTGRRADGTTFTEVHNLSTTANGELVCTVRPRDEYSELSWEGDQELLYLERALDMLTDILYVVGTDGTLDWWNDQLPCVTGYTDEEIDGMQAAEFFPEDQRDRVAEAIDTAFETGEAVVTADLVTEDGERTPFELTGDRLTGSDGSVLGLVGTGRDISEQVRREERLTAINETGRKMMSAETTDEVTQIGVEAAREILGLEATGVHLFDETDEALVPVAQTERGSDLIPDPPSFSEGDSIAWSVYESEEARAIDDVRDHPDVFDGHTDLRSELFLPIEGHGVLIASSTEKQAFDREDVILGKILARNVGVALDQVAQREQLAARRRELERQNERLDRFASVVSHDLQNPLQVASGWLEVAREDDQREELAKVANALDRMDDLVNDLLTLAREGESVTETSAASLEAVANDAWESVETGGATLSVEAGQTVLADESRLQQLFENLFRNAIEHGGDGVTVTVRSLPHGFAVEDDGPGIPDEIREAVFEVGVSTRDDGTGFGLSIVEQIAQAHDWSVRVRDGEAGGARFEFTGVESA